jgi:hypothetical protein
MFGLPGRAPKSNPKFGCLEQMECLAMTRGAAAQSGTGRAEFTGAYGVTAGIKIPAAAKAALGN